MIYDLRGTNYQEAKQGVSASIVTPHKGADRGVDEKYADGDILVIGSIPPFSVVTEAFCRISEVFPVGSTIDFGVPIWANDKIVDIDVKDTIPVDSGSMYTLDLGFDIIDTAGTPVGRYMLATTGPQPLLVKLNLPAGGATGRADFVIPFNSFGIRTGAYTS